MLDLLLAHVREEPAPLDPLVCPPRLAAVVMRCLRKDPSERFSSAHELVEALRKATPTLSDLPGEVPPPPTVEEAPTVVRTVAPSTPSLEQILTMYQAPIMERRQRWAAPMCC